MYELLFNYHKLLYNIIIGAAGIDLFYCECVGGELGNKVRKMKCLAGLKMKGGPAEHAPLYPTQAPPQPLTKLQMKA